MAQGYVLDAHLRWLNSSYARQSPPFLSVISPSSTKMVRRYLERKIYKFPCAFGGWSDMVRLGIWFNQSTSKPLKCLNCNFSVVFCRYSYCFKECTTYHKGHPRRHGWEREARQLKDRISVDVFTSGQQLGKLQFVSRSHPPSVPRFVDWDAEHGVHPVYFLSVHGNSKFVNLDARLQVEWSIIVALLLA